MRRMGAESSRGLSKGVLHFCEFCLQEQHHQEENRRKREGDLGKKNGREEWWEGGKQGSRKK